MSLPETLKLFRLANIDGIVIVVVADAELAVDVSSFTKINYFCIKY